MNFSEKFKNLRKKNSLSQQEVAKKLGVSIRTIGNYERKNTIPHPKMMRKIAKIFNISISEIISDADSDKKIFCSDSSILYCTNSEKENNDLVSEVKKFFYNSNVSDQEKDLFFDLIENAYNLSKNN